MRRAILPVAGLAGIAGLLLAVNPQSVGSAFAHFESWTLIPVVALMVVFYALQGLRWHLLLRAIGARIGHTDSQLINFAGQTMTAVLPLGDLTRAMMASRAAGLDSGATAATVTVQELSFTLLVVLAAVPALGRLPNGIWMVLVVAGGIAAVIAVLTISRLFMQVQRGVERTPVIRRFAHQVESLQRETSQLLRQPRIVAGALIDLGRVVVATAALALVLHGLHVDTLGWWNISLVLAASFVGGALSLLPGGVGANEATVVGTLMMLGVNPAIAAAAAILQRLTLTAVPAVGGGLAYAALRWRRAAGRDRAAATACQGLARAALRAAA